MSWQLSPIPKSPKDWFPCNRGQRSNPDCASLGPWTPVLLREGLVLGTLKCGSAAGAVPPLPSKPAHGFKLSPMGQLSAGAWAPSSPFPWCLVSTFSIKLISHISQLKTLAFVLPHVDFQASFHPHWRQQSSCSQPNRQREVSLRHPAPGTTLLHLEGCRGMGQQPQNPGAQKHRRSWKGSEKGNRGSLSEAGEGPPLLTPSVGTSSLGLLGYQWSTSSIPPPP